MTHICLEPVLKNSNYYILLEELEEHFSLRLLFTCLLGGGGLGGVVLVFFKLPKVESEKEPNYLLVMLLVSVHRTGFGSFPVKAVLPCYCHQVFVHSASTYHRVLFVGYCKVLPYNI